MKKKTKVYDYEKNDPKEILADCLIKIVGYPEKHNQRLKILKQIEQLKIEIEAQIGR